MVEGGSGRSGVIFSSQLHKSCAEPSIDLPPNIAHRAGKNQGLATAIR